MGKSLLEKDLEDKNMENSKIKNDKELKTKENTPKEEKNEKEQKLEALNQKEEKQKFKVTKKSQKEIEKEMEKMIENRKKRKRTIIVSSVIIGIAIIIGLFISTIFALVNMNNEKIISGVSIEGIDVSGLSKDEAIANLQNIYDEKMQKEISIKYEEVETSLNPSLMEVSYEVENAVNEAYTIGRKGNIFVNNYNILFTLIGKKDIEVKLNLNEDVTKQTIEDIGVNLPGIVIESSYAIENDELIITKGQAGIYIDTENLLNLVKEKLNDINASEDYIQIPVINKEPEPIDIEKIHEEVYKEPQDAYYVEEPFAIYPEVEGVDFDVEEAKAILAEEGKEEYVIKLTITKPKVTIEQIGTKAFPNQLSIFTTRYDVSDKDRSTNLELACSKINGKVVLPGETFSYNQTLGPRTVATGYKNAKIYSNGQVVDGIGGGICQISSTLYNAVIKANLEIVERRNHQFVTSYVPAGRDATVVYGATDFKFKNTRTYPIRIVASAKNGIATVSIYGIKEENEYTFEFSTKTVATIPYTTQYIEDGTLSEGTEKVKQKGANGLQTETYLTKMLNGKVISTTLLSKDTYNAMTRIVIKGTKKVETTVTTPAEPIEPETPSTPTETPATPETPSNPTEGDGGAESQENPSTELPTGETEE